VGKLAQENSNSSQPEESAAQESQETPKEDNQEKDNQEEDNQEEENQEEENQEEENQVVQEEPDSKVAEAEHDQKSAPAAAVAADSSTEAVRRKVKVCDGLGCYSQALPHQPAPTEMSSQQEKDEALRGGGDLGELFFPGKNTWEPEVHLNSQGEIRADHDDPNGHLMPHNKYQTALYPDGRHRQRDAKNSQPGITNSVASQLFEDTIVKAAPGFNAGLGRHTRAQEAEDWERNWETRIYDKRTGETLV